MCINVESKSLKYLFTWNNASSREYALSTLTIVLSYYLSEVIYICQTKFPLTFCKLLFMWFIYIYEYFHFTLQCTLLLLLSRFSCVRLCATPYMAAYQAPPSLGSSRQEHWSGLPFPSPMHESEKWKWSRLAMSDSASPWTAAYQAPLSMGFSRQEYWSGMLLSSPTTMHSNCQMF